MTALRSVRGAPATLHQFHHSLGMASLAAVGLRCFCSGMRREWWISFAPVRLTQAARVPLPLPAGASGGGGKKVPKGRASASMSRR